MADPVVAIICSSDLPFHGRRWPLRKRRSLRKWRGRRR